MFGYGGNSLRVLLEFVATTRVASCDVPDDVEDVADDEDDEDDEDDGDAKASTKRSCNTFFNPSVGKLCCLGWARTLATVNLNGSIVEQKGMHQVVAQHNRADRLCSSKRCFGVW